MHYFAVQNGNTSYISIRFLSSIPSPIIAHNEWVHLELYTCTGKVEWALNTSRCTSAPEKCTNNDGRWQCLYENHTKCVLSITPRVAGSSGHTHPISAGGGGCVAFGSVPAFPDKGRESLVIRWADFLWLDLSWTNACKLWIKSLIVAFNGIPKWACSLSIILSVLHCTYSPTNTLHSY